MLDFLTRQISKLRYSLGLLILLLVSLLLTSFDKIHAYSSPVHTSDEVTDCAKNMDTVKPA